MLKLLVGFVIFSHCLSSFARGGFAGGGGGFVKITSNRVYIPLDLLVFIDQTEYRDESEFKYNGMNFKKSTINSEVAQKSITLSSEQSLSDHLKFIHELINEQEHTNSSYLKLLWSLYLPQISLTFTNKKLNNFEDLFDNYSIKSLNENFRKTLLQETPQSSLLQAAFMKRGYSPRQQSKNIFIGRGIWNRLSFLGQSSLLLHELLRIFQMPFSSSQSKYQYFKDENLIFATAYIMSCNPTLNSPHNILGSILASPAIFTKYKLDELIELSECKAKSWRL